MAVVRKLRRAATSVPLDTALVLWLPGPETATGEDLVELHLHGGRAVVAAVEAALAELPGLLPAEPGAFTRRAFENGRLDLTQVEGLANLLAAETERQRSAALVLSEGGLRREVERWQSTLLQLAARAEAIIDFADEGDVREQDEKLQHDCGALAIMLDTALRNPPAERLRDGVRIAIAGPPNAGKSTLLNALVGREAAITSPIAGTTRDVIEAPVNLDGVPVIFTDTAGIRLNASDEIEAVGIGRAEAAVRQSDIVLWLGPVAEAPPGDHVIRVVSKSDLGGSNETVDFTISAVSGEGMARLFDELTRRATLLIPRSGSLALTSAQQHHVLDASAALRRAAVQDDEVLRAEDLRTALRALDQITGAADTEAMLDALFGRFCIGK